jgi:hypothetical protein
MMRYRYLIHTVSQQKVLRMLTLLIIDMAPDNVNAKDNEESDVVSDDVDHVKEKVIM